MPITPLPVRLPGACAGPHELTGRSWSFSDPVARASGRVRPFGSSWRLPRSRWPWPGPPPPRSWKRRFVSSPRTVPRNHARAGGGACRAHTAACRSRGWRRGRDSGSGAHSRSRFLLSRHVTGIDPGARPGLRDHPVAGDQCSSPTTPAIRVRPVDDSRALCWSPRPPVSPLRPRGGLTIRATPFLAGLDLHSAISERWAYSVVSPYVVEDDHVPVYPVGSASRPGRRFGTNLQVCFRRRPGAHRSPMCHWCPRSCSRRTCAPPGRSRRPVFDCWRKTRLADSGSSS